MINANELKLFLANNFGNVGQIHIQYLNAKPDFVGYIDSMNENTLDFKLKKMTVRKEENPCYEIDFGNIKRIEIKMNGTQEVKIFE